MGEYHRILPGKAPKSGKVRQRDSVLRTVRQVGETVNTRDTVTIGMLLRRLRVRRILIIGSTLLGLLLGLGGWYLLPRSYTATALVTVAPTTINAFGTTQGTQVINMESERAAMSSNAVVRRATQRLGGVSPEELRDSLQVTIPSSSLVLRVTSTTQDAAVSALWANAMARAYLDDRRATTEEAAGRISGQLRKELDAAVKAHNALPAAQRGNNADVHALRERIAVLATAGLNPGRVTSPATAPTSPSSLGLPAFLVAGAATGLLVGLLLALFRERTDRRVRSATWLADATGAVVRDGVRDLPGAVAQVASRAVALRPDKVGGRFVVVDAAGGPSPVTEAVRSRLRALDAPRSPQVLELPHQEDPLVPVSLLAPGDVLLLTVVPGTPRALVTEVREITEARGARLGPVLLRSEREGRPGRSVRRSKSGTRRGAAFSGESPESPKSAEASGSAKPPGGASPTAAVPPGAAASPTAAAPPAVAAPATAAEGNSPDVGVPARTPVATHPRLRLGRRQGSPR